MQYVVAIFLMVCYNSGHGGIAQLGERLNGIQEVMGSNPTISIKLNHKAKNTLWFFYTLIQMRLGT